MFDAKAKCPARMVFCAIAFLLTLVCLSNGPAAALEIVLNDVAPDRIERQRAASRGQLPLPGTPDIKNLRSRLAAQGLKRGRAVLLRVFKEESELEVWMRDGSRYVRFATYPICQWSGTLGPKLKEGDRQAPEGFYTIGRRQLRRRSRWPRSLHLDFPNAFDRLQERTGSWILVHGGCSSVGCFAMTNPVLDEIFGLVRAALQAGQKRVPLHVFPFRMTAANLTRHSENRWLAFWRTLKVGHDMFERSGIPPKVAICNRRYTFAPGGDSELSGKAPSVRVLKAHSHTGELDQGTNVCVRQPSQTAARADDEFGVAAISGPAASR